MHEHDENVIGVDTHKHTHMAVILSGLGRHVAELQVPASDEGTVQLLAWAAVNGAPSRAGSRAREATATDSPEGCWRLESPCSKVNRPDRANRRRKGKSDPVDAEGAARAVLSGQAAAIPKDREGAVEGLRSLMMARSSAVKATTTGSNQIKALLVGADQDLRESLMVKSLLQLATRASRLPATTGMSAALGILGRRWLSLHQGDR
jgi:transposase